MGEAQLKLFDLPEPERGEAEAEMPESIRQLLAVGFPGEAVEPLMRAFGGLVLHVPKQAGPGHPLVEALGERAAAVLCRYLGGNRFPVPKGFRRMIAARNAAIRRDYDQGVPVAELVRRYGLTERQVWAILGTGAR